MTEFDFDELDKAVNSLMSNVDTTKRSKGDDPEDKVVSLQTAPAPSVAIPVTPSGTQPVAPSVSQNPPVAVELPTPVAAETTAEPTVTDATTPALAVKRRGQFMDMVHPSSDMKSVQKPISRQGATLQPRTEPTQAPEANDSVPTSSSQSSSFSQLVATASTKDDVAEPASSPATPEWPDPIEITSPTMASSPSPTSGSVQTSHDTSTPAEAPLVSPFIADAKVEKRPLGTASIALEEAGSTDLPSMIQSAPQPKSLPEELRGDIVAVESTELMSSPVAATNLGTSTSISVQSEPSAPVTAPIATEEKPFANSEPATATVPAGGSIAQQYTEAPSTGDKTNGSIYDTDSYHQPIAVDKPAKKASSFGWVLWAVLLLAIGIAAGAAYYYFTR